MENETWMAASVCALLCFMLGRMSKSSAATVVYRCSSTCISDTARYLFGMADNTDYSPDSTEEQCALLERRGTLMEQCTQAAINIHNCKNQEGGE
jgi:hypothetical protein